MTYFELNRNTPVTFTSTPSFRVYGPTFPTTNCTRYGYTSNSGISAWQSLETAVFSGSTATFAALPAAQESADRSYSQSTPFYSAIACQ
ncbi:MAG: hypothetical protein NVSMB64_24890 [Candidatus Velthaea sp.]